MIKYAILFLLVSFQGLSAVYNVTRTDDPVPDTCIASECSLREAIIAANDNPGVDTILLDAKSYQLTLTGSDDLSLVGDLDILDELIIQGEAVELTTIDGDLLSDRVFDIKLASDTQINDLAIINGDAGAGFGGAIKINEADLKLNKVFLTDNISRNGGGIFATYSNLEIIDSLINGNHSDSEGGAIFSLEGQFNLQNSYIISNTSSTQGAGIYLGFNQSSTHMPHVAINDSFIINNLSESQGGGISINST
ncbi:MAG: CSLREA domain-containing protein, partial [Marinicella sp.]